MKLSKLAEKIENKGKFTIKLPIPAMGCGVLGLSFAKYDVNMGKYASQLLKSLEYRGYDSTGAAIQDDKGNVTLKKDVGAPSELVRTLGITDMEGKIFCGQVRWATFGAVTKENAQPHVVKCKKYLYGAHNGNITNTHFLKDFLTKEGHKITSDNDGEMLVHTVEHYFDLHLEKHPDSKHNDHNIRREAMINAILDATEKAVGSFAAVIVDPVTEKSYAIKAGSSLYAGKGQIDGNDFILLSSDLTAVLKFTKDLINLREGNFIEYDSNNYQVYSYKDMKIKQKDGTFIERKKGDKVDIQPTRSKLRAEDTELHPQFHFFMHQEIYNQVESSKNLITFFNKGSKTTNDLDELLNKAKLKSKVLDISKEIYRTESLSEQKEIFSKFKSSKEFEKIAKEISVSLPNLIEAVKKKGFIVSEFYSRYSNIFLDIIEGVEYKKNNILAAKVLDIGAELRELKKFHEHVDLFSEIIFDAWKNHSTIYTISCGTSYNATKTAALFFNEIAGIKIAPILPGNFRGQYSNSIRENDVLLGVSQSGETKDLIDIFNDIDDSGIKVKKVTIINNENSTLAQEKCDFYLPIKCGPEIAVPATKSYMNQVLLFYYLAIKVGERRLEDIKDKKQYKLIKDELDRRKENLQYIPDLINETIQTSGTQVDKMADSLYMEPSIHILATKVSSVAEEGSLKIRETVLNHTQGIEGSEFKHGPNTILGFNTIFGTKDIEKFIKYNKTMNKYALKKAQDAKLNEKDTANLLSDISSYMIEPVKPFNISTKASNIFNDVISKFKIEETFDTNYPLIFVTGPETRDVNLTISQINTHKIRGANTYLIAEENDDLINNARSIPSGDKNYEFIHIKLPKTDDTLLSTFSSMVVLQLLAFRMSVKKMKYLNKLHVPLHGVHPDVPKNVSKSITVD
ncbi:MAG: SIS domain-containing protein [Candidatus Delongbacteria bacterium]|jgi:glucosamine--fructose-6-phosphate aminotransferase (isomerizing)|nr:SIS domain-containing protein [Candidatus Delongbacteria bacterium]